VKPVGIGPGGILANGLFGGNSDFGSVAVVVVVVVVVGLILANGFEGFCSVDSSGLMLEKGLDGFCSVEVEVPKEVATVDVVEDNLANGFDELDVVDPNEKEGNVEEENDGALIPPKRPPPFDAGGGTLVVPPFIPVYNQSVSPL
jgi:hypothetical protein